MAALRDKSRRTDGTPQLRLAVATTKLTATARRVVMELGLGEFIELVACSDDPKDLFGPLRDSAAVAAPARAPALA